jgi:hypothetical protein
VAEIKNDRIKNALAHCRQVAPPAFAQLLRTLIISAVACSVLVYSSIEELLTGISTAVCPPCELTSCSNMDLDLYRAIITPIGFVLGAIASYQWYGERRQVHSTLY